MKRKSLRLITDLRNNMTGYPPSKILVTLAACKDHAECCWGSLLSQDYQIDSVSTPVPDAGFVCGSVCLLVAADEKGNEQKKETVLSAFSLFVFPACFVTPRVRLARACQSLSQCTYHPRRSRHH